jgi:transposase-like protein
MAFSPVRGVTYVDCPRCHWTKAVLAYENARKRCFVCPHCQHLWNTTETTHQEHVRLQQRTIELQNEHDLLNKKPFDQAERIAYHARLRKHREDLESRRRK